MCLPTEPFKIEREWTHAGLSCAVTMAREAQSRCGYVRVPPTHPLYARDYCELDLSVHGGLTFAAMEPCSDHEDGQGWWFGFDCAHPFDAHADPDVELDTLETEEARHIIPILRGSVATYMRGFPAHYWTLPEVIAETERLADQLAALAQGMAAIHG